MTKFIMPLVLIGIALALFFMFTSPLYDQIRLVRANATSYDEALTNSKALENERDKLIAKYNSINKDNLLKLQKLLPENIDNIRLILEIEKIAAPHGMVLKDVKYGAGESNQPISPVPNAGGGQEGSDYGIWNLEFSTLATYNNFLNFTRDLESNLRIVDISSVTFSSGSSSLAQNSSLDVYQYSFKIRTYWLKN